MDAKVSTKTKTFQNLNKNCPLEFIESSLAQILQALSLGSTLELEAIQGLMRALSFLRGF